MSQLQVAEIENTEHISVQDGENINAKRVALYVYDTVTNPNQWRRVSCDSNGQIILNIV